MQIPCKVIYFFSLKQTDVVKNGYKQETCTFKSQSQAYKQKNACGKWIVYVDADDYVAADYLQKLYDRAQKEKADAVFCYYYEDFEGKLKKHKKKIRNIKIAELGRFPYVTGACKIIKKEFFEKVIFASNCSFGEDSSISLQIALQKPKISILPEYLYFYRRHLGSVVLQKNNIYCQIPSLLQGYAAVENFCMMQNIFTPPLKEYLRDKMSTQIRKLILEASR